MAVLRNLDCGFTDSRIESIDERAGVESVGVFELSRHDAGTVDSNVSVLRRNDDGVSRTLPESVNRIGGECVGSGKGRYGPVLQSGQTIAGADPKGAVARCQKATDVVPGDGWFGALIEEDEVVAIEAD